MTSITSARSLLLSEEEALEGATTISLETQRDLQEDDIFTYIQENFTGFLKMLKYLSQEDQDILLSYYLLGKLLDVDTPIPTPDGWKRNGDIVDGDLVLDDNGLPTRVLKAHPTCYPDITYEIELDTGEKLYAGNDHLWLTTTYNDRQNAKHRNVYRLDKTVRTTQEIYETQRYCASSRQGKYLANHHIALTHELELPDQPLLVDPYCLGAWLGDGNSDCGILTGSAEDVKEILSHFSAAGYKWYQSDKDPQRWHILGLWSSLKKLGVIKNKHIPSIYLRASARQRLALLQGLMDTDGSCTKLGTCSFTNCSPAIIGGIDELLWSLGIKHQFRPKRSYCIYKGEKRYSDGWGTAFTTTVPCFRLPRKLARQKRLNLKGDSLSHHINKVTKVAPKLMRCLTVDSPSHLYLCGKSMIPTHNTQTTLATIFKSTQTVCSFRIRMAIRVIGAFLLFGEPTVEVLSQVLTKAGLEDSLKGGLSRAIIEYSKYRSFQQVADVLGLHRPDVRRGMSRAARALMGSKDSREAAMAAWIHSLVDKSSPIGSGYSKRKMMKEGHLYRTDPDILGSFIVKIDEPSFESLFVSRANR
jgi:replicative DNA helicase